MDDGYKLSSEIVYAGYMPFSYDYFYPKEKYITCHMTS